MLKEKRRELLERVSKVQRSVHEGLRELDELYHEIANLPDIPRERRDEERGHYGRSEEPRREHHHGGEGHEERQEEHENRELDRSLERAQQLVDGKESNEEKADDQADRPEWFHRYVGDESLFCRFFASHVIEGGNGVIVPNGRHPQPLQHADDVTRAPESKLIYWKTGFYRNRDSGELQFLLHTEDAVIYIDGLPDNDGIPVILLVEPRSGDITVVDLEAPENTPEVDFDELYITFRAEMEKLVP